MTSENEDKGAAPKREAATYDETSRVDLEVVTEEEFACLSERDRERAIVATACIYAERCNKLLHWYFDLKHNANVKMGVAVGAGETRARSVIVQCDETTWHLTPNETLMLVLGAEHLMADYTAKTGKSPGVMMKNLASGLRACFHELIDVTQARAESISDDAVEDEFGRLGVDRSDDYTFEKGKLRKRGS